MRSNEGMERVDLTRVDGKERHARWHNGWQLGPFVTFIEVGKLEDDRWYAQRYGRGASQRDLREGAAVYTAENAEHYARATADRWMRTTGGTWVEA